MNAAFKGLLNLPVYNVSNGKIDDKSFARKDIDADNITQIENNFGSGCTIYCKESPLFSSQYYFSYRNYNGKGTDINTILNAYTAAKLDKDVVIKL